jgi:hypothetical protein
MSGIKKYFITFGSQFYPVRCGGRHFQLRTVWGLNRLILGVYPLTLGCLLTFARDLCDYVHSITPSLSHCLMQRQALTVSACRRLHFFVIMSPPSLNVLSTSDSELEYQTYQMPFLQDAARDPESLSNT